MDNIGSVKRYVVDRIEEGIAVLIGDDDSRAEIDANIKNFFLCEGDIVDFDGVEYRKNDEETARRKADLEVRFRRLFKKKNL